MAYFPAQNTFFSLPNQFWLASFFILFGEKCVQVTGGGTVDTENAY